MATLQPLDVFVPMQLSTTCSQPQVLLSTCVMPLSMTQCRYARTRRRVSCDCGKAFTDCDILTVAALAVLMACSPLTFLVLGYALLLATLETRCGCCLAFFIRVFPKVEAAALVYCRQEGAGTGKKVHTFVALVGAFAK